MQMIFSEDWDTTGDGDAWLIDWGTSGILGNGIDIEQEVGKKIDRRLRRFS